MSEYKKEIAALTIVAVLVAVGLAVGINTMSSTLSTSAISLPTTSITSSPTTSATVTTQTLFLGTTQQDVFSATESNPLLVITPQNRTFVVTYDVMAKSPTVLSFNASQSYAIVYTNGTNWVSYSEPCSSQTTSSVGGNAGGQMVNVISKVPCGQPPGSGWAAVNGSIAYRETPLTQGDAQVSIEPVTITANQAQTLRITVTLGLKPGVYSLGLVINVRAGNLFENFPFNPISLIVKS